MTTAHHLDPWARETMTAATFAARWLVTIEAKRMPDHQARATAPTDLEGMTGWRVRLAHLDGGDPLAVNYYMGAAWTHHGPNGTTYDPPTVEQVLYSLAADAQGVENVDTFEEWAQNYGYDTDSRKAEATYRAVVEEVRRVRAWLSRQAWAELLLIEDE